MLQLSSHSVHANVGNNNHVMDRDKRFGLVDRGLKGIQQKTKSGQNRAPSSALSMGSLSVA